MKSMTGYGRATAAMGMDTLTVVVSSVNRKALDLQVKLPSDWEALEVAIGEAVRRHASRGKVQVSLEVSGSTDSSEITWDDGKLAASLDKLQGFAKTRGIGFSVTPELLWQMAMAQRRAQSLPDAEEARAVVVETVEAALLAFGQMRTKEGETLLKDFQGRLELLKGSVATIAERAPQVAPAYRELLMKRLRDSGLELNLDDERVLKEVAIFADRCDITEEITRFRSHMEQFTTLLHSKAEIGRKAEFILQELGREANTMGSKANDIVIARQVIELKNELERVKEQIMNVE
jgi:uncharacterized protein (TIGR00255 family)